MLMWLENSSHLRASIQMLGVFPIMFQKWFSSEAFYRACVTHSIRTVFVPKGRVRTSFLVYNGLNSSIPPFPKNQDMS